jgi:hypothetical protein
VSAAVLRDRAELVGRLIAELLPHIEARSLVRQSRGDCWGVAWWTFSGRGTGDEWLELRIRHWPAECRLDAVLLAFRPLRDGGGTRTLGKASASYDEGREAAADLLGDVAGWLAAIGETTPGRWKGL